MENKQPTDHIRDYFLYPKLALHKQYLAMRDFFLDGKSAEEISKAHGYSVSSVYSLVRDFKIKMSSDGNSGEEPDPFFKDPSRGRPRLQQEAGSREIIVECRKKNMGVPEIKSTLDAMDIKVSEKQITKVLREEGFARLPRRDGEERKAAASSAPVASMAQENPISIGLEDDRFSTQIAGLMLFAPIIKEYGIDALIQNSPYPGMGQISNVSAILSFLALKLGGIAHFAADDSWCMDKGMGLFAGLNALPATAWLNTYASQIDRDMNIEFLKALKNALNFEGMFTGIVSLCYTAVPYWSNNAGSWPARSLSSVNSLYVYDPTSGLGCYADTTVKSRNSKVDALCEFIEFCSATPGHHSIQSGCFEFNGRFTTYSNLDKMDKQGLTFITLQRKSKMLREKIARVPEFSWKPFTLHMAGGQDKVLSVYENETTLKGCDAVLRQVAVTWDGKGMPDVIVTNNFEMDLSELIKRYSEKWLNESELGEQLDFFHLNRINSELSIDVDFDLTMTMLANNLYRLLAMKTVGNSNDSAKALFGKLIDNAGEISIGNNQVEVKMRRKKALPYALDYAQTTTGLTYPWLNGSSLVFSPSNTT
ncbi:MAG: hypothetical protein FWG10_03695 [Eubacteriaceae bacterium]|nr:hypothetical protein [Eubacteriaceae bacterium]